MTVKYLPDDEEARNHPLRKHRGWSLDIVQDKDGLRVYDAVPPKRTAYLCPVCAEKGRIKERRLSAKNYIDLPRYDKHVELRIRSGRFTCTNEQCPRVAFKEALDELDQRHHITTDLRIEILSHLRRKGTFSEVASMYGLNEQTLRKLEKHFVEAEDKRRREEHALRLPVRLGMFGLKLARKSCCLLTNVDTERVVELIPSGKYQDITDRFQSLFDPVEFERVLVASIPLNTQFHAVAKGLFPRATIFVPRNEIKMLANDHLVSLALKAGMRLRFKKSDLIDAVCRPATRLTKNQQRILRRLFEFDSVVKRSYEQRLSLLEAYTLNDRDQKLRRFAAWREGLRQSSKRKEVELLHAKEWQEAIIEGMSISHTDYVTRVRDLIALLFKAGRGYSFETIRGRLLYGEGLPTARPLKTRARLDGQATLFEDEAIVEGEGPLIDRLITLFTKWAAEISPKNTKKINRKISR